MNLKKQLKAIIKGDVLDNAETLEKYSHDASLFEVKPQVVVSPKSVEDLKNLVKFVSKKKGMSLTARSGGTDMTGGPLSESIVINFMKYFNHVKEIGTSTPRRAEASREGWATTEPGVYYRDFEKETLKHGLIFPSYPASREICALGGMVANNAGGEKTLTYGKTEDYVQKLKVVLADSNEYTLKPLTKSELDQKMKQKNFEGQIYRKLYKLISDNYDLIKKAKPNVSKNSSGYLLWNVWDGKTFDLTQIFTGAQGTLGLITEIKLGLIKPKKYSKLLVIFLNDVKPLAKLVGKILKHKPESFESFDNHTMKLGMRYLFWRFAFQFLPEIKLIIKNGFRLPKMVMLAEFTGNSEKEVRRKALAAQQTIAEFELPTRITSSKRDTQKYWTVRRESFNLLRERIKDKQTAPFIDDLIVRPEQLPQFLPQLEKILSRYDITFTVVGHVGNGNFHIIPLMNLADPKSKKIIPELSKKVYDLVFKFKGSMSAEHNDGLTRTPYVKQMFGEKVYELFQETKNIFDPNNIFNPGKKVGGSLNYSLNHLKKK